MARRSRQQYKAIMSRLRRQGLLRKQLYYSDEFPKVEKVPEIHGSWKPSKRLPSSIKIKRIGPVDPALEQQVLSSLKALPESHLQTIVRRKKLSDIKLHGHPGFKRFLHQSPASAVVNILGRQGSGAEYLPYKIRKGGVIHIDEPSFTGKTTKLESFLRKHLGGVDATGSFDGTSVPLTMAHETAHALDEALSRQPKQFYERFAESAHFKKGKLPTQYSHEHPAEHFAEAYALYASPLGRRHLKEVHHPSYVAVRRLFEKKKKRKNRV